MILNILKSWRILLIVLLSAVIVIESLKINSLQEQIFQSELNQARAIAAQVQTVRNTEKKIKERSDEIAIKYEQRIQQIKRTTDRTIADIESNNVRLRNDIIIIKRTGTDSSTGQFDDQTRCELQPEFVRYLVREAARADRNTEQLNSLVDSIETNQTFFERLDK